MNSERCVDPNQVSTSPGLCARTAGVVLFLAKLLAWDAEAWGLVHARVFPPRPNFEEAMREARAEVRRARPDPATRPPPPPAPPARRF